MAIDVFMPLLGDSVFLLVGLFASGIFTAIVRPEIITRNHSILLVSVIALFSLAIGKGILYVATSTGFVPNNTLAFFLPLALAPILATILLNSTMGVIIGIWTSLAMTLMAERNLPFFVTGIIASVVAAQTVANVRTRSKIFRAGFLVGLFEVTCISGFTALNWKTAIATDILHQWAACIASGFFAAVIVILFFPLFELIFRVTSNITLLELSDMGHPLLQRLAMEAPGTYHHSLVVASLAHAAAEEIGANPLLARVCAYYHDVGKLTKPDFFAENIRVSGNPHDDLPPSMSTLIITSHVKEGVSLALAHKLPQSIIQVISEHHGTSLISYFHHKAKSQIEFELSSRLDNQQDNGGHKVNENDFRYPGPRPTTRESVIICLADAVEAASRTMEKKSPGHIEELVRDITNSRIEDDQFNEADITFTDLSLVRRSLVFNLTNILHGRIAYPKDENRDSQPTEPDKDESRQGQKAD
jgi:putative nucleotidyltransferase with HDIG domain